MELIVHFSDLACWGLAGSHWKVITTSGEKSKKEQKTQKSCHNEVQHVQLDLGNCQHLNGPYLHQQGHHSHLHPHHVLWHSYFVLYGYWGKQKQGQRILQIKYEDIFQWKSSAKFRTTYSDQKSTGHKLFIAKLYGISVDFKCYDIKLY